MLILSASDDFSRADIEDPLDKGRKLVAERCICFQLDEDVERRAFLRFMCKELAHLVELASLALTIAVAGKILVQSTTKL